MKTKTVKARKVREGDFLPGLDNGYVFADAEIDPDVSMGNGISYTPTPLGNVSVVMISFHDADGDENYLICGKDMPVTVARPSKDKS